MYGFIIKITAFVRQAGIRVRSKGVGGGRSSSCSTREALKEAPRRSTSSTNYRFHHQGDLVIELKFLDQKCGKIFYDSRI